MGKMTVRAKCSRHPEQRLELQSTHNVVEAEVMLTIEPCSACEKLKASVTHLVGVMAHTIKATEELRTELEKME